MITPFQAAMLSVGIALAIPAQADPMQDICQARAREMSGYKGAAPRLEWKSGRTTMRLSGSVAVGGSTESGPAMPAAPGGYGVAAQERFEDKRREKSDAAAARYRKIYDDCMRDR